jgi:UDP-glucose 4-epimerase
MRMRGKKVIVTGGLGFIGSNLAIKCLEEGAEVTIFDTLDNHSGGNIYNIQRVKDSVKVIVNDIRNFEGICSAVIQQDYLFNCAAYTSHPNSMKDPLLDIDVNCNGTVNILEAARRFNQGLKIVHVGTSTQIGRMVGGSVDELHPEFPLDIYSATKSASEKFVLIYGTAYRMRTTVIRLANVFGPRSSIKTPEFGFMNYFIGLALQNKTLTVFGDGGQLRNISYIDDCVEAMIVAALSDESNGQAFFAVSDNQCSVAEIATKIAEVMGGRVSFVEWPSTRKEIDVGDAVISNAKIKATLKWTPAHDLRAGLSKTKDFYAECLEHYLR